MNNEYIIYHIRNLRALLFHQSSRVFGSMLLKLNQYINNFDNILDLLEKEINIGNFEYNILLIEKLISQLNINNLRKCYNIDIDYIKLEFIKAQESLKIIHDEIQTYLKTIHINII